MNSRGWSIAEPPGRIPTKSYRSAVVLTARHTTLIGLPRCGSGLMDAYPGG